MTTVASITVALALVLAGVAYMLRELSKQMHGFIKEQVDLNRAVDSELDGLTEHSETQARINADTEKAVRHQHEGLVQHRDKIDALTIANNASAGHLREHCEQINMMRAEVERCVAITEAAVDAAAAAQRLRDAMAARERVPTEELAALDKALARFMHEGRLN